MRNKLPAQTLTRPPLWTLLKNFVGKDLIKITMPVVLNEPLTFLQKAAESIQHCNLLRKASEMDDPSERMELVCAFIAASLSSNSHRLAKPFNPLLYETYEYEFKLEDDSIVRAVIQQVSHHPPITAGYFEHDSFEVNVHVCPKIKFWGKYVEIIPEGISSIYLKNRKERYVTKGVSCSVHNIIIGKLWFEHVGPLNVKCIESNVEAQLVFKSAGWFSQVDLHKFEGNILKDGKKVKFIFGKWTEYVRSTDLCKLRSNNESIKSLAASSNASSATTSSSSLNSSFVSNSTSCDNASIASRKDGDIEISKSTRRKLSQDMESSKLLWKQTAEHLEQYYNFTLFTMSLNELTPELEAKLPRTDSRLRPDVRKLEEGDIDKASSEKSRLEDKQRENRAKDIRFKDPSSDFLWFDLKDVPYSNEKCWVYNGQYWNCDRNSPKFPDLF